MTDANMTQATYALPSAHDDSRSPYDIDPQSPTHVPASAQQGIERALHTRRQDNPEAPDPRSYAARAGLAPPLNIDTNPKRSASNPVSSKSRQPPGRKHSVSDRSPLQKLETTLGDLSKEEKRALLEDAEQRAIQRSATAHARIPHSSNTSRQRSIRPDSSFFDDSDDHSSPAPAESSSPQNVRDQHAPNTSHRGYAPVQSSARYPPRQGAFDAVESWERSFGRKASLMDAVPPVVTFQDEQQSLSGQTGPQVASSEQTPQSAGPLDAERAPKTSVGRRFSLSDRFRRRPADGQNAGRGNTGDVDRADPSTEGERAQAADGRLHSAFASRTPVRRYKPPQYSHDWKTAKVARLRVVDLDLSTATTSGQPAWWEKESGRKQHGPTKGPPSAYAQAQRDGGLESTTFRPPLHLKCGPLLRYTSIKSSTRGDGSTTRVWQGSVMIVCDDASSSYSTTPSLRLFSQPMELLPDRTSHPAQDAPDERQDDPVAGQPKCTKTGETVFVRPAMDVKSQIDLSLVEGDEGLFQKRITALGDDTVPTRVAKLDGEKLGKYADVDGHCLHKERGYTFWRFLIEVELPPEQTRIAYRINHGSAIGFWIPAFDQPMNVMFHSCNGFSLAVEPSQFSGPDPLWRDVLNKHQSRPFHVMLGGGDQIYNDAVTRQTEHFAEWLTIKNPDHKYHAPFSVEMQEELESFYLERYCMWFSQGLFGLANSQIPMVNMWDDHDIIDGFGSYPHHFMSTPVFTGVGGVAFKYYMLFQHQSVPDESEQPDTSWLVGAEKGPYISEKSRSLFMPLGKDVQLLALDCRTERTHSVILSQDTYERVFDRCHEEIEKGEVRHLLVLLGVPIAYPRLNFLENILTSRVMYPVKALGRTGALGGFVNKFDGGVEILDDLDDHWTAKHHKHERNWFIQELQELAAEKSVRITILGGDVHLAAVGRFRTSKKFDIARDRDHRYMPNVVSSAIVNTPPPEMMADILNRRNKIHHLDDDTDEDMIPLFTHDVNGKPRNNHCLLPRRNWCSIREYEGLPTPIQSPTVSIHEEEDGRSSLLRRSLSLGRSRSQSRTRSSEDNESSGGSLMRRLSKKRGPPSSWSKRNARDMEISGPQLESNSLDITRDDSFTSSKAANAALQRSNSTDAVMRPSGATAGDSSEFTPSGPVRSNSFQRRPSHTTDKHARQDRTGRGGIIDLQGGLEVVLHCEIDQKDPGGHTEPYRLIVPALFYDGPEDLNVSRSQGRLNHMMNSFRRKEKRNLSKDTPVQEATAPSQATAGMHDDDTASSLHHEDYHSADEGTVSDATVEARGQPEYEDDMTDDDDNSLDDFRQYRSHDVPESSSSLQHLGGQATESAMGEGNFTPQPGSNQADMPRRSRSQRGPKPPSNLDRLPASVRNRYSQFDPSSEANLSLHGQTPASAHIQQNDIPQRAQTTTAGRVSRPDQRETGKPVRSRSLVQRMRDMVTPSRKGAEEESSEATLSSRRPQDMRILHDNTHSGDRGLWRDASSHHLNGSDPPLSNGPLTSHSLDASQSPDISDSEEPSYGHSGAQDHAQHAQTSQSVPRPYAGPGRHWRDDQGGLPLPRPVGLAMSEKASRQLGYPEQEFLGSWMTRDQHPPQPPQNPQNRYYTQQPANDEQTKRGWKRWI